MKYYAIIAAACASCACFAGSYGPTAERWIRTFRKTPSLQLCQTGCQSILKDAIHDVVEEQTGSRKPYPKTIDQIVDKFGIELHHCEKRCEEGL